MFSPLRIVLLADESFKQTQNSCQVKYIFFFTKLQVTSESTEAKSHFSTCQSKEV